MIVDPEQGLTQGMYGAKQESVLCLMGNMEETLEASSRRESLSCLMRVSECVTERLL